MQVKEYKKLEDELFRNWQQLWNSSEGAHFFNSPNWLLACSKVFVSDDYRIITIYDHGELVAVLPLKSERRFGIKTLVSPGGKHLSKSTLLMKETDPRILSTLVNYLSAAGSFYLEEIDTQCASLLSKINPEISVRHASINPYVPLSKEAFNHQSSRRRKKVCKLIEKEKDNFTYRCFRGNEEGIKIAFGIDEHSSKRKKGKATFVTPQDRQFFLELVRAFKDQVVVCVLYYREVPIVFEIGFIYKDVYHVCNTAYHSNYASFSPRRLLFFYSMERLLQEGFGVFDFSRGLNPLKQEFTSQFYEQHDAYYIKNALVGKWWKVANGTYDKLLKTKAFYTPYLFIKKTLIAVQDKILPKGQI